MINNKQSTLKDYDCSKPPTTNKSKFWDTCASPSAPKYRNIPVNKTNHAIKVTGIFIENVSGVKEVENVSNFNRNNALNENTKPSLNTHAKRSKYSTNVITAGPPNAHQFQTDPAPFLLDRQNSLSEPTLPATKDRGDSAVFEDVFQEETTTVETDSKTCLGDGKPLSPKKQIVKGLLYIRNAADVYKSEIEAKKLQVHEKDIFKSFPGFTHLSRKSMSKNLSGKNTQMKQIKTDENSDFDIAILLSGLVSAGQTQQKRDMKDFERKQRAECKVLDNKTEKRKKPCINKSNASPERRYQIANKSHISFKKLQRAKKCDTTTSSHLTYKLNKPSVTSSDDDSDEEFELKESGTIVAKRKRQEALDNDSNDVKHAATGRLSCKSSKSDMSATSIGTRVTYHSSVSRYRDGFAYQKPKINEEEMWENFEMMFKSYASTSRHAGDVISRKISTEWMINAEIVDGIITQKQADDAFRRAAGAKITMNAKEYKEFLIRLSLKLKLSYYEIYRRMCGM